MTYDQLVQGIAETIAEHYKPEGVEGSFSLAGIIIGAVIVPHGTNETRTYLLGTNNSNMRTEDGSNPEELLLILVGDSIASRLKEDSPN